VALVNVGDELSLTGQRDVVCLARERLVEARSLLRERGTADVFVSRGDELSGRVLALEGLLHVFARDDAAVVLLEDEADRAAHAIEREDGERAGERERQGDGDETELQPPSKREAHEPFPLSETVALALSIERRGIHTKRARGRVERRVLGEHGADVA